MGAAAILAVMVGCASGPRSNPTDPLEPFNRSMSNFNEAVDNAVLKPVATGYKNITPAPVRTGVANFFANLGDLWSAVNNLLQLKVHYAAETFLRFNVNTFFGLAGILDVAGEAGIERHREDFGQTLAYWGVPAGPYLVLPLLGPSTLRDTAVLGVETHGNLLSQVDPSSARYGLYTLRAVEIAPTCCGRARCSTKPRSTSTASPATPSCSAAAAKSGTASRPTATARRSRRATRRGGCVSRPRTFFRKARPKPKTRRRTDPAKTGRSLTRPARRTPTRAARKRPNNPLQAVALAGDRPFTGSLPGNRSTGQRTHPLRQQRARARQESINMNRRDLGRLAGHWLGVFALAGGLAAAPAAWAQEAPDALIKRLSTEVLDTIKADKTIQAGDVSKVMALVDSKIMPNVNFQRMTASAVGPGWRQATPEQQKRLQEEFKTLLVRTYSGALAQVSDQAITVKPLRAAPEDKEVVVRTEVRGRGDPIQLDYRMEKGDSGWKIFNLNVLGVWLVETYRSQFSQEINAKGVDGLIAALAERNKATAAKKS